MNSKKQSLSKRLLFIRMGDFHFFTNDNLFVFGSIQANSALLRGKFASQKMPLPYQSFVVLLTDLSKIKSQPVGECLGAPVLFSLNSLKNQGFVGAPKGVWGKLLLRSFPHEKTIIQF